MHAGIESPNTSPQAIELNPSCSEQAHFNRLDTGHGCESMEPGCTPAVLSSINALLNGKRGCLVQRVCVIASAQLAQTVV